MTAASLPRPSLPHMPKHLLAIPGQRQVDAQTLSMIVALASQVTVMRARLDACERVLTANGLIAPGAVDAFTPDEIAQRERDTMRTTGLSKIFRALQEAGELELAEISAPAPTAETETAA